MLIWLIHARVALAGWIARWCARLLRMLILSALDVIVRFVFSIARLTVIRLVHVVCFLLSALILKAFRCILTYPRCMPISTM